jgi:hypothetical protein
MVCDGLHAGEGFVCGCLRAVLYYYIIKRKWESKKVNAVYNY